MQDVGTFDTLESDTESNCKNNKIVQKLHFKCNFEKKCQKGTILNLQNVQAY